jgi:hypothetical protein
VGVEKVCAGTRVELGVSFATIQPLIIAFGWLTFLAAMSRNRPRERRKSDYKPLLIIEIAGGLNPDASLFRAALYG